ncbi:MAG: glycosyltransferase [Solirubrobacterales bacterium]|nr:glycosyltransferase [Solirubrobacterales bacterium]MBV9716793.1 glycosyltransferase [Solirubrobacterales bacterium]
MSGSIAVVVVSRNRLAQLCQTLPRHLDDPAQPRVVLVDDASTDGTPEAVRRRFPAVEVITLPVPRGAVARNVGLRSVAEPYVAFCDDDAWFEPGSLGRAAALLDGQPRLAVVNPRILVGSDRQVDPVCEEMARSPLPAAPQQPGHPLLSFIACAVVVRRDAALQVGGFCERFQTGAEEKLLGWDLAAAGWQLSYVPELVARHCPPGHDGRPRRRAQTLRNELWTNWLRRSPAGAVRATVRELRGSPLDTVTLRGIAEAAGGAGWVISRRRRCPAIVEQWISLLEEGAG